MSRRSLRLVPLRKRTENLHMAAPSPASSSSTGPAIQSSDKPNTSQVNTLVPTTASANQQDEPSEKFDLFSVRRPKHAIAGLSSGLKNIGRGLAGGLAAMVAMPIQGAKEDGVKGFSKGLLAGAVSGVALTVAGAATGVFQVGRGIYETPNAIKSGMRDQVWNPESREWYYYSLPEEAARVLQNNRPESSAPSRTVVDTSLYDELGVSPSASQQDIKKAYRLKAIQLHPDKNPDDERASEKFQKLGAAYQILSDENLRASYDLNGKAGVEQQSLLDSSQLFELVFGSQRFEEYIGELRLMQMQNVLNTVNPEADESEQEEVLERAFGQAQSKDRQLRREVQCALNLATKLEAYIADSSDDHISFRTAMEVEARELSNSAFGGTLLGVLGYVYEEQALNFLGFHHNVSAGMGVNRIKKSAHVLATKFRLLSSAAKAYKAAKKAQEKEEKRKKAGDTEASSSGQQPDSEPDAMPFPVGNVDAVLETIWNVTVLDVESTLRAVCEKVFTDSSVSLEQRRQRARGLLVMATAFQKLSQSTAAGLDEFKSKFAAPIPSS